MWSTVATAQLAPPPSFFIDSNEAAYLAAFEAAHPNMTAAGITQCFLNGTSYLCTKPYSINRAEGRR
jgi:hypothetical protein